MASATSMPYRSRNTTTQTVAKDEPNMWMQLLEDASSDKKLPEKTLLVLGGDQVSQEHFLELITPKPLQSQTRRPYERQQRQRPKVSNRYGLGYTYQDVLDHDQEDILARMSIHLLSDARTPYAPLLDCTFTPNTISHTLAVILLDWDEPWLWLRQFRERIFMLKSVLDVLDNNSKDKMDNSMKLWRERRIGPAVEGTTSMTTFQSDKSQQPPPPPLGPGEWDEPLGIPLCIVCHRAENVHILAREHAWNDTHFDHILQHLRTIVLKHGGSLVYTSSTDSGSDITDLVRSSLDIHSLLKKTIIKPEAIARDKILIPPNWDTWGKIKTLDADFDAEGVSKAWSAELDQSLTNTTTSEATATISPCQNELFGAYEQKIQGPNRTLANTNRLETPAAEAKPRPDLQAFLASQVPVLKRLEAEDAEERRQVQEAQAALQPSAAQRAASGSMRPGDTTGGAVPYIGPVSINVGGVTIDVDEAVRGLQSQIEARKEEQKAKEVHAEPEDEHKKRLEWFAGLASRKKSIGGSPATPSTPTPYTGQDKEVCIEKE